MINPFTAHPALYWLGGPAIVALAFSVYQRDQEAEAAKAAALADPPKQSSLRSFDPVYDISPSNEVSVLAQVDQERIFALERQGRFSEEKRWVAPLYAPDAEEPEPTLGAVLYVADGPLSAERIAAMSDKRGPLGPVARVDGRLVDPGAFDDLAADAMARGGMILAPDVMFIEPFPQGREAALGPSGRGARDAALIAGLGVAVFVYGFLWRWIRRRFL